MLLPLVPFKLLNMAQSAVKNQFVKRYENEVQTDSESSYGYHENYSQLLYFLLFEYVQ